MEETDYILIGYTFNKFLKHNVDRFKCSLCGDFRTEGKNLIEFHVLFQCKGKRVQSQ